MTLSVQNLKFSYERQIPVLEGISFFVAQGEFIAIFGPNGGGKTTLLKLILGLLKPTTGEIKILGEPPQKTRSQIGYVPQVRGFDRQFPISVLEVVLQGCLSLHRGFGNYPKKAKQKALGALEKVGLEDKAHVRFGDLSGGQIQRTLIARALAPDPKILLLDEATVGIDRETLAEIFSFLLTLRKEITIFLVTHDLQDIAKDMDRLFCIQRQLTIFSPEQVCEHFALGLYHPPLMKKKENDESL